MWRWTLHPEFGIINYTLTCLGITKKAIPFLSDPTLALLSLILVRAWRGAPYAAFSFLAGLQSIPKEIYEAAEVDGAGTLHKFLHISLPLLKPIFAMVTTLLLIWTFQLFEIIYVLTGGGPYGSTITFSIYIYQAIFSRSQINLANSGSVIVAALMTIASYIYFRRFGRK
jgi:multiple sugar transport system permease protein